MSDPPNPSLKALEQTLSNQGLPVLSREAGALLRTLVASKPIGVFLELQTSLGTAWMLDGMDEKSYLVSLSSDPRLQQILQAQLSDERLEFRLGDPAALLKNLPRRGFDLIFASTWTTHSDLETVVERLRPGGFLIIASLSPQSNEARELSQQPDLKATFLSGVDLMLVAKAH